MVAEPAEYQVDENEDLYFRLIAKCWVDESFKKKLLPNTMKTIKDSRFALREGLDAQALADIDSQRHLIIQGKPYALSDDELEAVVGGKGRWALIRHAAKGTQLLSGFLVQGR
ncbi:hypothetical protein F6R98_11890 [Candidatus Methylospira mobilis]|uniref:Uncharacterized protein n=1 Tax=Candidatus Methylospira mobilis TaxID=1808979 RepID=A0A5Q0BNA8_9GAMM|nr:hypothetical protein [Candidatus Methylospira mobilis]QFY43236.1 hypothetical protein F6R98_11890 [Candidatus Methylospira mobilis]